MFAFTHTAHRNIRSPRLGAQPSASLPDVSTAATSARRCPAGLQSRAAPAGWSRQQASYYFDAAWHTTQTLRRLLRATQASEDLGLRPAPALLTQAVEALLQSIRPGLSDDVASRACFDQLLQAHLSGLSVEELAQLGDTLRAQCFDLTVMESVIDDPMIEKFGFANGPPHQRQRTLMFPSRLHAALETAGEAAACRAGRPESARCLTPGEAQQARDLLAASAARYRTAGVSLNQWCGIAAQLAQAVGLHMRPATTVAVSPLHPVSSVAWQGDQLLVELSAWSALSLRRNEALFAVLLRDLLELMLAHRLGSEPLQARDADARRWLFAETERVLALAPVTGDRERSARAAEVLGGASGFGTIQVCPTVGVALGHASIAPILSAVPDRTHRPQTIGTRYMRSGFRLEPTHSRINEWDIRWLNHAESQQLYPAERAWHLRVPAGRAQLEQAATALMRDWERRALPYRFIGTEPGMPATGCRMTVWHAVQQALNPAARTLFEDFRLGLPEPESPTELALRIEQFMHWLQRLAGQNEARATDL